MIRESEYLADVGLTEDEADDRTVADALVEQVCNSRTFVFNDTCERVCLSVHLCQSMGAHACTCVRAVSHGRWKVAS